MSDAVHNLQASANADCVMDFRGYGLAARVIHAG
jgi:hypothetical protein